MGLWDKIKSAGNSLEKWGDNLISGGENTVKWGVDQGKDVIEHSEDSFTNVISTPLLILAVGVAFFLYNSNAGQVAEASKNIGPLMM